MGEDAVYGRQSWSQGKASQQLPRKVPMPEAGVPHIIAPHPGSPGQHLKLWMLAGIQIHSCLLLKPVLFLVYRWSSEGTSALGLGER